MNTFTPLPADSPFRSMQQLRRPGSDRAGACVCLCLHQTTEQRTIGHKGVRTPGRIVRSASDPFSVIAQTRMSWQRRHSQQKPRKHRHHRVCVTNALETTPRPEPVELLIRPGASGWRVGLVGTGWGARTRDDRRSGLCIADSDGWRNDVYFYYVLTQSDKIGPTCQVGIHFVGL